MNSYTTPELYISKQAKQLGIQLIKELQIAVTADLTLFLEVNPCFNGQQATLIWIHQYLNQNRNVEYQEIRKAFLKCFPDHF